MSPAELQHAQVPVGPVQVLLADGQRVPLTAAAKKKYQAEVDTMAASALRCLAFAQKTDLPGFAGYDGDLHHPVSLRLFPSPQSNSYGCACVLKGESALLLGFIVHVHPSASRPGNTARSTLPLYLHSQKRALICGG